MYQGTYCIGGTDGVLCLQIVNWLAQFKPKQLTKQQLVKPILESLCKLCAEADPEDHDQDDQLSASKFASQVCACSSAACTVSACVSQYTCCKSCL